MFYSFMYTIVLIIYMIFYIWIHWSFFQWSTPKFQCFIHLWTLMYWLFTWFFTSSYTKVSFNGVQLSFFQRSTLKFLSMEYTKVFMFFVLLCFIHLWTLMYWLFTWFFTYGYTKVSFNGVHQSLYVFLYYYVLFIYVHYCFDILHDFLHLDTLKFLCLLYFYSVLYYSRYFLIINMIYYIRNMRLRLAGRRRRSCSLGLGSPFMESI